jgi:hypothetical protein
MAVRFSVTKSAASICIASSDMATDDLSSGVGEAKFSHMQFVAYGVWRVPGLGRRYARHSQDRRHPTHNQT